MPPSRDDMKVSNSVTLPKLTQRRPGGLLAERLRENGWTIRDAADYLGVSRQRIYTVFDDPRRARLWECAVAGMPMCTPEIKLELKQGRKKRLAPGPRPVVTVTEFEEGDVVTCSKEIGFAQEGIQGYIAKIQGDGPTLQLLVVMPDGEDWFPRGHFHEYFTNTGLNRNR